MKTMSTQNSPIRAWRLRHTITAFVLLLLGLQATGANALVTYQVGTGTTYYSQTSTAPPGPLGNYYNTNRMQYLYLASELTAAGMSAGYINQIGFNVLNIQSSNGRATENFSIGMGLTTATSLTSTGWNSAPGNVYFTAFHTPALGWNYFTANATAIPTPGFYWDGTSNIVVEVCNFTFNGSSLIYGLGYSGVAYHTTTGKSIYRSAHQGATLCGFNAYLPNTTTYRPNMRFVQFGPCTGPPTAGGIVPGGTTSGVCPGTVYNLVDTGYTRDFAISYQWQVSTNGGTTWTNVPGGNGSSITTAPILTNTRYRFRVVCGNTADTTYSTSAIYNVSSTSFPVYASLPFFEGFESWVSGCSNSDLPSYNWTTQPSTGNPSFRRDDQGVSTGGWSGTSYYPQAAAFEGLHDARWNGYYSPSGTVSSMNVYLNCSATTGTKELQFYYNFNYPYASTPYTYPGYKLMVDTSTDAGATWGVLTTISNQPQGWTQVIVPFNSNSATTVIRFRATSTYAYDDMEIDAVKVLPACSGMPTAGVIDSIFPCNGVPFKLKLTGTSQSAGLTYNWEYRPTGTTGWASLPGGNVPSPTATITTNTDFRVTVTCPNSNLSDTSIVVHGVLQPFYYCYCSFLPQYVGGYYNYDNIGNVLLTKAVNGAQLLNNGNALPTLNNPAANKTYTDFRRIVPAPVLIRDSVYRLQVTVFTTMTALNGISGAYPANAWIDFNRDGIFQPGALSAGGERVLNKNIQSQANPTAKDTFRVPRLAPVGLTGLRVTHFPYYGAPSNPCGTYGYNGEIEDYLVYLEYQPCNGPLTPGYAHISDTSVCPGYGVDMYDTAYQTDRTGIVRGWQVSTNNGASWSFIAGSAGKDSLFNVIVPRFNPTLYRFYVMCSNTGDTSYSYNTLRVTTPTPERCYPVSQAIGGPASDTSDIGAFRLGSFVNPTVPLTAGPHLMNPAAHRRRTDYTKLGPIGLEADSSYRLSVFHTMPGGMHADALVSVWIDFNRDLLYSATGSGVFPSELIFRGRTTPPDYFLDTVITMPHNVIPNMLTGVRVMLSNDLSTAPTNPIFVGSGSFVSGEVEDYLAIFRRPGLGVNGGNLLQELSLFPNPTGGKFTVMGDITRAVSQLEVVVTTITGQQVMNRTISNSGMHFSTELDLSGAAKGIYFVELRADGEKITRKLVLQ